MAIAIAIGVLHAIAATYFLLAESSGEAAGLSRLPLDETWSRLVYARSFSESLKLEFNSGAIEAGATSPLWVALIGAVSWLPGLSDDNLPALAKITGVIFGATTAVMVYRITWQITRRHFIGALAGVVVAVEPNFIFASVSGLEVTLFAALALATSWSYLRGRPRTAGILAALTIAARPEGVLLALLIVGSTFGRWMWRREGAAITKREDVFELAHLGLPSFVIVIIGIAYNWSVNGSPLPNAYLVRSEDIGLFPVSNMWNVWLGYFHQLPFMFSLAWVVGLPVICLGAWSIIKRHKFSAVPLSLFTLALGYSASVVFNRPGEEWQFIDRRHMDAALPFITILLFCGGVSVWQWIKIWRDTRATQSEREVVALKGLALVAGAAVFAIPLLALPLRWAPLTEEYSRDTRIVNQTNVAMGEWLASNTAEDAVIGASPAGAIRFLSGRTVIDMDGLNSHEAVDFSLLQYAVMSDIDYIVAFRNQYVDSIPGRPVAYETTATENSAVLRVYGPLSDESNGTQPRQSLIHFDSTGLVLLDIIDVGNITAEPGTSEVEHDYAAESLLSNVKRYLRASDTVSVEDDARVFSVAEEITVASVPGKPLTVVKRYDAATGGMVRVFADGHEIGEWELPRREFFFGESSFTIPADFVSQDRTRLRFEVIPTRLAVAGVSYFYWILTPEEPTPVVLNLDFSPVREFNLGGDRIGDSASNGNKEH